MSGPLKRSVAAGLLLMVSASGCGSQPHQASTSITVFASSAMIKSLTAIGKQFEAENPGTSVEFIFGGSSDLAAELSDGIDADVFVSGDHANMAAIANAGLVAATPVAIAANSLVIATGAGNHDKVASLADLARPGLRVSVCGEPGACGAATRLLEDRTGVRLHPRNVDITDNDVIKDITSGKVDAGLVFKTEALTAGDNISWFAFPEAPDATVTSWIAPMKDSSQAALSAKFIHDVTGDAGRKILADNGFADPDRKFES
jgi:molybdate transport system substrate-binding protein